MKEIVERILEGKFKYDKGALDFSCSKIELTLTPNIKYTDSFSIVSKPGTLTEGHVYSYDMRLTILTDSFLGNGEEIGYTFNTFGLDEGDVVKGEIYIISNQGEFYLPYVVNIANEATETSMGVIRNLFHFTNLAKSNWNEAVKLFYTDGFKLLLTGNDKKYLKTYLGLSRYFGNEQNVEEFLLEINKKHAIEYIPEQSEIVINDPSKDVSHNIIITRNGWGYTALNVETDSDFIAISKTGVNDDDFLGNYLTYPIIILKDLLHPGNNYATVRFYNSFTSFEVKVSVNRSEIERNTVSKDIEFSRASIDLMLYFIAFRTKKINTDTWIAESKRVVDRMQLIDESDISARLFKAQLLITEERFNEAKWILDQAEEEFKKLREYNSATWAYYLYLTTLYNRDDGYVDQITEEIQNIYNSDTSAWRVAWLLLYLTEEFAVSPSRKWLFIESQLSTKCNSPVFYVEAANMLNANPQLLNKADRFEQKVIRYMVRHDLMSEELIDQFIYVVSQRKQYSDVIFEILKGIYAKTNREDVVSVICEILIEDDRKGPEYYEWYLKAVEAESHVTRLYEYYMMSVDLTSDVSIPRMVLLYFSYNSSLDWEHNAYLYARIVKMKNEESELYFSYKEDIERFALDMIMEGRINKDLAHIYRAVINENVLSQEIAERMSKLIFAHRISVDTDLVSKVIIYQCRENTECAYPIENREAIVPIYTNDYTIMFEDNFSNRYMKSVSYDMEKLMVPGKLATMIIPYVKDNLEFDVYVCECSNEMVEIDEENQKRYQNIFDSVGIDEEFKSEIRAKLMDYYFDHDKIRELDAILNDIDPSKMDVKERVFSIRFLVMRGFYDKALSWISEFGYEGIEPRDLVKLCSRLVTRSDFEPSREVTCTAAYAFFKGKYDEYILKYLADNFHGMTKDIRKIFVACENFDIDIYRLCENTLIQMLYTGYFVSERMDIYKKYVSMGANPDVRLAFLTQCAFEFFVREQLMEGFVFEELTKLAGQGVKFDLVCKLAYVKYFSEHKKEAIGEIRELITGYLKEFLDAGIYMTFFKEFMEEGIEEINRFSDKTIIEYKTEPGRKVLIHYVIERDEQSPGEYVTREMKDMYGGVHAKSFVLFFGENLLYYITEQTDNEEHLTESGSVSKSDISRDITESRFNEINDIVIAKTLQDYDTAEELIYEYYKKDYVVKKLFSLQ